MFKYVRPGDFFHVRICHIGVEDLMLFKDALTQYHFICGAVDIPWKMILVRKKNNIFFALNVERNK